MIIIDDDDDDLHHDFGLLDEVVLRHGALLDHLDGHVMLALPLAVLDHPELAVAQLFHEGEVTWVDLPNTWKIKQKLSQP